MRPFGRWSYARGQAALKGTVPAQGNPNSMPQMWGLIQISGQGQSAATLLRSKIGRYGSPDLHVSDVETPRLAARRHEKPVLGSRGLGSFLAQSLSGGRWCLGIHPGPADSVLLCRKHVTNYIVTQYFSETYDTSLWPACRQAWWPMSTWPAASGWPLGHRVGGWVIYSPRVV
jgi:hypothetical protein